MNCHYARELISPYLDHQLTGREMLSLQDHFASCLSCEREMVSIRQVKALLRGLRDPGTPRNLSPRDFSRAVSLRLEQEQAGMQGWRILLLPAPKPQRGRRLVTALALSCLTVVSFAAPFAPEGRGVARTSSSFLGSGSPVFALSSEPDATLTNSVVTGRTPERITLIPVNDLPPLLPDASSTTRPDPLMMTEIDAQSGWQMTARSQDVPFKSAQFAVARTR